ncbi:tRNA pseudouridine synthase B [Clostridioides difficile]|nr:tRNA pseudouridine synthase B [Clostridioides difficile]
MNKIISILKPTGMTSHDVVSRVRKILNIKKVGHTGTLDPDASGVLPICIGKATKVCEVILKKINRIYVSLP